MTAPGWLTVDEPGVLTTVQDRGRPGYAALGVPRSGALDAPAATLANRLVGNGEDAAVLEVTLGGLRVHHRSSPRWTAVTGAPVEVFLAGRAMPFGEPFPWSGEPLSIGSPATGVRSYVAVAGGVAVPAVLGSRSSDVLAGLGPTPLGRGDRLPLGDPVGEPVAADVPLARRADGLRLHPGPRAEWIAGDAIGLLCRGEWTVMADSNRVGLRLHGTPLRRAAEREGAELPSEGIVLGAVQVPPDGQPVVFLHDHPTTGGYPVVAVVDAADLWQCAQARPGERVRFQSGG